MIKTQIQLEEWQYDSLKKACRGSGRSMSDFIRESVSLLLNKSTPPSSLPLEKIAGKYRPLSVTDLKGHDRDWVNSIR
jgi:Arc/MetJ-type ribon-helix-helix transcriptional regulator